MTKKKNKLIKTTGDLVVSGIALSGGSAIVGKLPTTGASAGVGGGFTKMAGFYPLFASAGAMGIVTNQFKGISKKVKKKSKYK